MIGASIGAIGTAVGQQHLRSILSSCHSPMMNAVDTHIHFTPHLISDSGEVTTTSTKAFLSAYMRECRDFIERVLTVHPRSG